MSTLPLVLLVFCICPNVQTQKALNRVVVVFCYERVLTSHLKAPHTLQTLTILQQK